MLHYLEAEARKTAAPAPGAIIENVSRRKFLGGALAASGFVLAVSVPRAEALEPLKPYPTGGEGMPHGYGRANDPHVYVAIAKDGAVKIIAHRSEMGTGVRTSLPLIVADEMEADWSRVGVVQAPGDEPLYGNQDTDGSRSMRHFIQSMRECGAAMRQMLEQAAAATWGVDVKLCRAKAHFVVLLDETGKETGKKLGFGELAQAAMALPVPPRESLLFKTPDEFTYMRKGEAKIVDLRDITMGKAVYGADVRLPGMKFAAMARPGVLGGKIKSFDASAAKAVPGVEAVYEIAGVYDVPRKFAQLGGIAVVADTTFAAMQGRDALQIEWDDGPNASYDTEAFFKAMSATAAEPGKVIRNQGDFDAALKAA
ncbi:MAG: molybdopterin cofactor-binding domain-containing protein, partial [Hyphomicrobium sp.]